MPTSILRAKGLVKRVPTAEGELTILGGIDLDVDAGGQVAVVGESGSGKTTLLGILAGLDLPTLGRSSAPRSGPVPWGSCSRPSSSSTA